MLLDVEPVAAVTWVDEEDRRLFAEMATEARSFLGGHPWCTGVSDLHVGAAVPGVVAALLARVQGTPPGDEWLWVIVGDVPSAYLVTDHALTSSDALRRYVELLREWV